MVTEAQLKSYAEPEPGQPCISKLHSHMTHAKVEEQVAAGAMEWVTGTKQNQRTGKDEQKWIPVAKFLNRKKGWKGVPSFDGRVAVKVMQLV